MYEQRMLMSLRFCQHMFISANSAHMYPSLHSEICCVCGGRWGAKCVRAFACLVVCTTVCGCVWIFNSGFASKDGERAE